VVGEGGFCVNVWLEEEPPPGPTDVPAGHAQPHHRVFDLAGTARPKAGVIQVKHRGTHAGGGLGGGGGSAHHPCAPAAGERTALKPKL